MGRFLKIEFPEIKNTVIEITNSRWVKQLIRYLKREQINWMIDLKKLTGGGGALLGHREGNLYTADEAPGGQQGLASTPKSVWKRMDNSRYAVNEENWLGPSLGLFNCSYCTMSFSLAGLTGLLDGFIAQYWDNQKSAFVHLLIKYLFVPHTLAWPMQILFQLHLLLW